MRVCDAAWYNKHARREHTPPQARVCDAAKEDAIMKIIYNDGHAAECPEELELEVLRHSAAHIMAQAVKRLYPNAHFAYGPATEKGFHYDIDLGDVKLSDEDLPAIEKEMQKIVKENLPFKVYPLPRDEAVKLMQERGEIYKVEHIADLAPDAQITFYQQGVLLSERNTLKLRIQAELQEKQKAFEDAKKAYEEAKASADMAAAAVQNVKNLLERIRSEGVTWQD